ncbi:MAG: NifU family protein [Kiritimatiellae bacterium]|nr:NifU family protein [Kiritimatiellia bacterium]MBR1837178.1 NifU family protein [Kiritimatiellia bacterium]
MEDKIREKLQSIRTMLQQDGGDCEIVKIEGKTVTLELKGACGSCPYAMETLKGYVQESLRTDVDPEIVVERV